MAVYDLPLQPSLAEYRFATVIKDAAYIIDVRWNSTEEAWYLDWYQEDLTVIAIGLKVVRGAYIGRRVAVPPFTEGVLVAVDTTGGTTEAAFDDLGTRVVVRYIPTEDIMVLLDQAVQAAQIA